MKTPAIIAALLLLFAPYSLAKSTTMPAGQLADMCAHINTKPTPPSAAVCGLRIEGFIQGYRMGAFRGLAAAFIYDEGAQSTTKGFNDIWARITASKKKATCIPDDITLEEFVFHLLVYLARKPEGRDKPYPETLRDMVEDTYCSD